MIADAIKKANIYYLTEHQFTNMYVIVGEKTVQERAIPAAQLAFF